jgi:hypothetical protein
MNGFGGQAFYQNMLNKIAVLHDKLCDGVGLINTTFTFQIIPFGIYSILLSILGCYIVGREIFVHDYVIFKLTGFNTMWLIMSIFVHSCIILSSVSTTNEVNLNSPKISIYFLSIYNSRDYELSI